MFKCALVCTDFEDSLQRLIGFVPDLVQSGLDKIVFFHNVSLTTDREIPKVDDSAVAEAKSRLADASGSVLPEGKSVVVDVRSGRVIDNIEKSARRYNADVLVLGTPTRSLLTEKFFGSTTTGIAHQLDISSWYSSKIFTGEYLPSSCIKQICMFQSTTYIKSKPKHVMSRVECISVFLHT